MYRPDPRNTKDEYLSQPVEKDNLVLRLELEPDLNSSAEYLSRGTIERAHSSVARAIKMRAKSYKCMKVTYNDKQ